MRFEIGLDQKVANLGDMFGVTYLDMAKTGWRDDILLAHLSEMKPYFLRFAADEAYGEEAISRVFEICEELHIIPVPVLGEGSTPDYIGKLAQRFSFSYLEVPNALIFPAKAVAPDRKIIGKSGNFVAGKDYEEGWYQAIGAGANMVNENFVVSPEWMINNYRRYNKNMEHMPHACIGTFDSQGEDWFNALAEGVFMLGLQNACTDVDMVSKELKWGEGRGHMTSTELMQMLFMHNQGDVLLGGSLLNRDKAFVFDETIDSMIGEISVQYVDGEVKFEPPLITGDCVCEDLPNSIFSLRESRTSAVLGKANSSVYSIRMKAILMDEIGTIRLDFAKKDPQNYFSWVLGGTHNNSSQLELTVSGRRTVLTANDYELSSGNIYDLLIWVMGRKVTCFVNGKLEHSIEIPPLEIEPLYASATLDEKKQEIIIKMINIGPFEREVQIAFPGCEKNEWNGESIELYCMDQSRRGEGGVDSAAPYGKTAEFLTPNRHPITTDSRDFVWKVKSDGLSILRLQLPEG